MKRYKDQTVESSGLAPAAVSLLEYLSHRRQPLDEKGIADIDGVIDEMLIEAYAARCRFRQIAIPAIRLTRQKSAKKLIKDDYQFLLKRFANRQVVPLAEIVNDVLLDNEVQGIITRFSIMPTLIGYIQDVVKESNAYLRVESDTLVLGSIQRELKVINDANLSTKLGDNQLLENVARTWASRGRGLVTPIFDSTGNLSIPAELSWSNALANALVVGEWTLDRDIRTLEDLRTLPTLEGNDGGITLSIIAAAAALGAILIAVSSCVSDPTLKEVLFWIGALLLVAAAILAVGEGIPIEVCRTDPDTGMRICGTSGRPGSRI